MEQFVCCDFSHNLLVEVVTDLYPGLVHSRDFLTGHHIHMDSGNQCSDPFFLSWKVQGIEQPDPASLKEVFLNNEAKYRASLARRFRDSLLDWSDGKADVPSDAPEARKARAADWAAYRQALRDLPEQPGFPHGFTFPEAPGQGT